MKTHKNIRDRKLYNRPEIARIILDNQISLQLASEEPPSGPDETYGTIHESNSHLKAYKNPLTV